MLKLRAVLMVLFLNANSQAQEAAGICPEILIQPESNVTVIAGESVAVTCVAHGSPMPDIIWLRDGDETIDNQTSSAIIIQSLIEQSEITFVKSTLGLCSVAPEEISDYSCLASSTQGNQTATFQLVVIQENTTIFDFPPDTTANISETVSFSCSASGIPLPEISWYKDGSLLDTTTTNITETLNDTFSITSVLLLSNPLLSSAGQYSCNASNVFSGTDSREFTFTVENHVALLLYPEDIITNITTAIESSCTATGIPPPDIAWLKDGTSVTSELNSNVNITQTSFFNESGHFTLSTLNICDLDFSDSSEYSCVASNTLSTGQATDTRSFTLEVQAPPNITVAPVDQTVRQSTDIELSCNVSGVPLAQVEWSVDTGEGLTPVTISNTSVVEETQGDVTVTSTLTLLSVQPAQSGVYVCETSNSLGTDTALAQLTVFVLPSILIHPGAIETVDSGSAGTFQCVATGVPRPTVSWFRNGMKINNESYSSATILESTLNETYIQSILDVCPFESSLAGIFSCQVSNFYGNSTITFELLVNTGNTTIFDFPLDTTANISETVSFSCSASGIPLPEISWYKDGSLLDPTTTNITETLNDTFSITSVLMLSNLLLSSAGQYSCNASNVFSGTDSREFTFTVESSATILLYPSDYITHIGASVVFSCTAIGIPSSDILWQKRNENDIYLSNSTVTNNTVTFFNDSGHFTIAMLNICDLDLSDSSEYSCVASNTLSTGQATDTRSFTLEVQVPPTVTPLESEVIGVETRDGTPSQITVGFTITGPVLLEDITWTYTPAQGNNSVDVTVLATSSSKYEFSDDLSTLTIFNLDFFDAGNYTLRATNVAGMATESVELVVHVEPELLNASYSGNETVEGQNATFSCVADGYPLPNIVWLHNNNVILDALQPRHSVIPLPESSSNRPHIPNATNSTLTVSKLRLRDSGEYLCRVDPNNTIDGGRPAFSERLDLQVLAAPAEFCTPNPCRNGGNCSNQAESYLCLCTSSWEDINCTKAVVRFEEVALNQDPEDLVFRDLSVRVTLTCEAVGSPTPRITWFKDGDILPGEMSTTLIIPELTPSDRGVYKCKAENFYPESNESSVKESQPSIVNVNGITQYNMTINFSTSRRRRRQSDSLNMFVQSLAGVQINDATTVFSVEDTGMTGSLATLLITLLATEGGSEQLTRELSQLVNSMALAAGLTVSQPPIRFDGCVAENTILPDPMGGDLDVVLMWPESDLGVTVTLQCPCGNLSVLQGGNTFNRTATRRCGGSFTEGAEWEAPMQMACNFSSATRRLCQVASVIENTEKALGKLESITDNENIGVDELGVTTILLEVLTESAGQDSNNTETLLEVVDNLLVTDTTSLQMSQEEANTSARILTLVEVVAQSVPIPESEISLVFQLDSLAVAVTDLDPGNFEGLDFSIDVVDGMAISDISFASSTQQVTNSLSIPSNFLMGLISSGDANTSADIPRITNVVYFNDVLFLRREERNDSVVGGIILAASLSVTRGGGGGVENRRVEKLDPPIQLVFLKNPSVENGTNTSCNFWDFAADDGFGDWSSMNCYVVQDNDTFVVCECTHFTNFAILLDPNPVPITVPPVVEEFLSAISLIGVTVSIICLILTVLSYISSEKLRTSEAGQLLLHLSFGLLGIYVLFIICFVVVGEEVVCAVAGGFLHYFLLVTIFLMAAEAVNLYTKLVIVLGVPGIIKNRYVLKASLISWIVPLFIVIASEAPNWRNYVGDRFCRPYNWPFWGGLLIPFGLIYIFNWVIFLLILGSLLRKNETNVHTSLKTHLKKQLYNALLLSLLFGLGWGLGFVITSRIPLAGLVVTLQAIFILLTAFQGFLIFLMNAVRSTDAREVWLKWIRIASCNKVQFRRQKTNSSTKSTIGFKYQVNPKHDSLSPSTGTNPYVVRKGVQNNTFFANESAM